LKTTTKISAITALTVAVAGAAFAAESSLIGIALYDTGIRVVSKFGAPDEIQALTIGGSGVSPAGTSGTGGRGGPGGSGGGNKRGGGGGAASASLDQIRPGMEGFIGDPFGAGSMWSRQDGPQRAGASGGGGGQDELTARGSGSDKGGGGASSGGGVQVQYTRWVYRRGGSRYAFVLDNHNRVVQIEAIGLSDGRVKTKKGVTFGANFAQLIRKYQTPDGYEINGDTIIVRFLQREKVAFRLQRVKADRPQTVTGIVVAAGK